MALIACGECGGKVSDKAATCPHCGVVLVAKRKQIGLGSALFTILVIGFVAMKIDGALRSGDSVAVAPAMAAPAKAANPFCATPKKNGTMDARACDLAELCKDWVFYKRRVAEFNAKGDAKGLAGAQESFAAVNKDLSEYSDSNVSACLAANGG